MKRIKRRRNRDRFGIVRGSIALCLLIALSMGLFITIQFETNISAEKNHAALAARQAAARFGSILDDKRRMLESSAGLIHEQGIDNQIIFNELTVYGGFSKLEIESAAEPGAKEIQIDTNADALMICMPLGNDGVLNAWIPVRKIAEEITGVLPAGYDLLLYDSETGEFLINNSIFKANGYYDVLLELNEDGILESLLRSDSGVARIEAKLSGTGDDYYIAQQNTEFTPFSIALMIPEGLLNRADIWSEKRLIVAAMFAEAVVLACFVFFALFVQRRIRISNRNAARALNISERMNSAMAGDAQITSFVFSRAGENILGWYDGIGLLTNNSAMPASNLSCLEEICGLMDGEIERIHKCLTASKLLENTEIHVRGTTIAHEERIWRISAHAIQDDSDFILCSIKDSSREQLTRDRQEREDAYRASIQKKASSIWTIEAGKDRWRLLHSKHRELPLRLGMADGQWSSYSSDLTMHIREYLHPADFEDFLDNMGASAIMEVYRSGKTEFNREYRVRSSVDKEFEWHRMLVRIWQDRAGNGVIANLYVFNVDAQKNAELERGERKKVFQRAVTALGGIYQGLYYVDLENDLIYTARSLGADLVDRLCAPYKKNFENFIAVFVHPEDHADLKNNLSAYMLRKTLTEGKHLQIHKCRYKVSDDIYGNAEVIVQPARFENGIVKEVVLAVRAVES